MKTKVLSVRSRLAGFSAILSLLALGATDASAVPIGIDFDVDGDGNSIAAPANFIGTTALTTLYSSLGITFSGSGGSDGGAILDQQGSFGVDARSGRNFLAFNRGARLSDGGIPRAPETISFDTLVNSFSIFASGGGAPAIFQLEAFLGSALVGSVSSTSASGAYTPLTFALATGFDRVVLTEITGRVAFVFDDLVFETGAVAVPEPSSLALLGMGALSLLGYGRHRRQRTRKNVSI